MTLAAIPLLSNAEEESILIDAKVSQYDIVNSDEDNAKLISKYFKTRV